MPEMIFVKPVAGATVPDIENGGYFPTEGTEALRTSYVERRILDGSLREYKPKAAKEEPEQITAQPAQPAPATRQASGSETAHPNAPSGNTAQVPTPPPSTAAAFHRLHSGTVNPQPKPLSIHLTRRLPAVGTV